MEPRHQQGPEYQEQCSMQHEDKSLYFARMHSNPSLLLSSCKSIEQKQAHRPLDNQQTGTGS
jgi:hypothetical protein